jgi:hypothetical protein
MIPVKYKLDPASFNNANQSWNTCVQSYFGNFILFERKFMMKADTITRGSDLSL